MILKKDNIDSRECISEWKSKVAAETEMITKKALKKDFKYAHRNCIKIQ